MHVHYNETALCCLIACGKMVPYTKCKKKYLRPDKLDLLFLISHFLDLGAGGQLLFITSLFNLMSRNHEACLT